MVAHLRFTPLLPSAPEVEEAYPRHLRAVAPDHPREVEAKGRVQLPGVLPEDGHALPQGEVGKGLEQGGEEDLGGVAGLAAAGLCHRYCPGCTT